MHWTLGIATSWVNKNLQMRLDQIEARLDERDSIESQQVQ